MTSALREALRELVACKDACNAVGSISMEREARAWTAARTALQEPAPVVAREVADEVARAIAKFPTWPTDPLHALAVLGEEFGELTKAVLQSVYEPHKVAPGEVHTEALQTAAMALRFLASLDRYRYTPGEQHEQTAPQAPVEPAPAVARDPRDEGYCLHCWQKGGGHIPGCSAIPYDAQAPVERCNQTGPGRGVCSECAAGHYERCLYAVAQAPVEPAPVVQPEIEHVSELAWEWVRAAEGAAHDLSGPMDRQDREDARQAFQAALNALAQLVEDARRYQWLQAHGMRLPDDAIVHMCHHPLSDAEVNRYIDAAIRSIAKGVES